MTILLQGQSIMIKKVILSRYARTKSGKVAIDISAGSIRDLYQDFDRTAPYIRRDLDPEFAEYLIESVHEIGKTDFMIRITFVQHDPNVPDDRIKKSIENHFIHMQHIERREQHKMLHTSLLLLMTGVGILITAVWVNRLLAGSSGVIAQVLMEGLNVAAWVSLWEALANLLIHWAPHRQEIKLFRRLSQADVQILQA